MGEATRWVQRRVARRRRGGRGGDDWRNQHGGVVTLVLAGALGAPAGRCWGRWATEGRRAVSGTDFRAAPALQVFAQSKGAAHWPAALCVLQGVLQGMGLT